MNCTTPAESFPYITIFTFVDRMNSLNVQSETRIYCGFRENMIRISNKPFDEVDFNGLFADILNALSRYHALYA